MNLIKKLALGVAFGAACCGAARAAEEDTTYLLVNANGNILGNSIQYYPISNLAPDIDGDPSPPRVVGDTFVDDFVLEVLDSQTYYVSLSSKTINALRDVSFASVTMLDFFGDVYSFHAASLTSAGFFGSITLASGLYDLEVDGSIARGTGAYDGFISTTVPEPAEWALLLSGLGALGVWQRRRAVRGR